MEVAGGVKVTTGKIFTLAKREKQFTCMVQEWLESEDTFLEKGFGYGICALTFTYFLGGLIRSVF